MASQNYNFYINFRLTPLFLVSVLVIINSAHVRGTSPEAFKKNGSPPPNGTVETFMDDDGDVVDCVDIYKQPAFNHPLLKRHKLQMEPSWSVIKERYENKSSSVEEEELIKTWQNNNNNNKKKKKKKKKKSICSKGSVPIRRRQLQQGSKSGTPTRGPHYEFASIVALPSTGKRFYGGGGDISVWEPFVSRIKDYSASALIVSLSNKAYISAGWIVYPELYGDFKSRFFVYWTIDDSVNTGCFDLRCEGFVQVSKSFALGATISPISILGSDTYSAIRLNIYLDRKTKNWWLEYNGEPVGYWPAALFIGIQKGAQWLQWGGRIYDSVGNSRHTKTDMGNGLFPDIAAKKASRVCSIEYVDSSLTLRTPFRSTLRLSVTNPLCYNAKLFPTLSPTKGLCFLFGGSGRNPKCP